MVPSIINLKIETGSSFRFRLWLPVIILWPFILALILLLLPFLALAELILRARGERIFLFRMLGGFFAVCMSLSGTIVNVRGNKQNSIVNVTIH